MLAVLAQLAACRAEGPGRVFVLGLDGADPQTIDLLMSENKLPLLKSAFSLLVNELAFRKMAQEFLRSPALIFFSGMILMPAGLAVVLSHNVWVLNWPLIITLLGWIAVISGALRVFAPDRAIKIGKKAIMRKEYTTAAAAFNPSSMSPFSRICRASFARRAQRPARQSACSSTRTEFWFDVSPLVFSLVEPIRF